MKEKPSRTESTPTYLKLRKYCYFHRLSDGALEALSEKLDVGAVPAGAVIIQEGDPADAFYFIVKGNVEVLKKTAGGKTSLLSVLGQGEGFGEMALLTCSPRSATVTAKTDVAFYKLYKEDFNEIVRRDCTFSTMLQEKAWGYEHFNRIKTLEPFALLPPEKMAALIIKMEERRYAAGENIVKQGDPGDLYCIIKSGRAAVLKENFDGEIERVAALSQGSGFGEEALITGARRNATVQAIDDTVVWTISKPDFDLIMKSSFLEKVFPPDFPSDTQDNFLDVRMKDEFEEEHIPGAVNIPLDELRRRYSELNPGREYYVYCLAGARSDSAAFLLNSQGFKAKSMQGGIGAWTGPLTQGTDGVHTPLQPQPGLTKPT